MANRATIFGQPRQSRQCLPSQARVTSSCDITGDLERGFSRFSVFFTSRRQALRFALGGRDGDRFAAGHQSRRKSICDASTTQKPPRAGGGVPQLSSGVSSSWISRRIQATPPLMEFAISRLWLRRSPNATIRSWFSWASVTACSAARNAAFRFAGSDSDIEAATIPSAIHTGSGLGSWLNRSAITFTYVGRPEYAGA